MTEVTYLGDERAADPVSGQVVLLTLTCPFGIDTIGRLVRVDC